MAGYTGRTVQPTLRMLPFSNTYSTVDIVVVGERRADHILPAQLYGQDGYSHAIFTHIRALAQWE